MLNNSKKIFLGGLNGDDALSMVPEQDYLNAQNVRIVSEEDGSLLSMSNVSGNRLVSFVGYNDGDKVLRAFEDPKRQRVYFFTYSPVENYIGVYDKAADEVRYVIRDTNFEEGHGLNFSADGRVNGVDMAGDLLFFTDYRNEPRRVNVERGQETNHPGYDSDQTPYGTLRNEDIAVIRRPPNYPLEVRKETVGHTVNSISRRAYQFACRYVYRDNEHSVLSTYSELINYNKEGEYYDSVRVRLPFSERIPPEVKSIQVLVREGNTGSWHIIFETDSDDGSAVDNHNNGSTQLEWNFSGREAYRSIGDEDAYRPFDNVPLISRALAVGRNRLFLMNNLVGYDPVPTMALSAEVVLDAGNLTTKMFLVRFRINDPQAGALVRYTAIVLVDDDSIETTNGWYQAYQDGSPVIGSTPGVYDQLIAVDLTESQYVGSAGFGGLSIEDVITSLYPGAYEISVNGERDIQVLVDGQPIGGDVDPNSRFFKAGGNYQVAVIFTDDNERNAGVTTASTAVVDIPLSEYDQPNPGYKIQWSIDAPPDVIPSWATKYHIARKRNTVASFFIEHYTQNPKYVRRDDDNLYVFEDDYSEADTEGVAFDISRLADVGIGYSFQLGDIVRVVTDAGDRYDLAVADQQGKWIITEKADLGNDIKCLIEIFTPSPASYRETFYEVARTFPIVNGDFSSRSGSINGDVHLVGRSYPVGSTEQLVLCEAMSPNDKYWREWLEDIGRPSFVLRDEGQQLLDTGVSYSNTFVQDTKVNGLSRFDVLDSANLDDRIGSINVASLVTNNQEYGTVMLLVGQSNTASVYLGQTQFVDDAGNSLIASSGNVIGTVNILQGGYGTSHPESFVEEDGMAYWFDARRGAVVRYSSNGLFPISNYKLVQLFRDLGRYARSNTVELPATYDRANNEYLITIPSYDISGNALVDSAFGSPQLYTFGINRWMNTGIQVEAGERVKITGEYTGLGDNIPGIVVFSPYENSASPTQDDERIMNLTETEETVTVVAQDDGYIYIQSFREGSLRVYRLRDNPHLLNNGRPKTLAFSDKVINGGRVNRWVGHFSYTSDELVCIDNTLIGFKNGKVYPFDATAYNTFYGEDFESFISVLLNAVPNGVKVPRAISVEGSEAPSYTHIRSERPFIQETDLVNTEYRDLEGVHYSEVLRDRLSPDYDPDWEKGLLFGDEVRGQYIKVSIHFSDVADRMLEVNALNLLWLPSHGHRNTYPTT